MDSNTALTFIIGDGDSCSVWREYHAPIRTAQSQLKHLDLFENIHVIHGCHIHTLPSHTSGEGEVSLDRDVVAGCCREKMECSDQVESLFM